MSYVINDAKKCDLCDLWLRDAIKYEEHKLGRKHRKNRKKRERAEAAMQAMALTIASKFLREAAYREKGTHIRTALLIANKLLKVAVTVAE